MEMESDSAMLERASSLVKNDEYFLLKDHSFSNQYSHVYSQRLILMNKNEPDWGEEKKKQRQDARFIVGILYKQMKLKPSILGEYIEKKFSTVPPAPQTDTKETKEAADAAEDASNKLISSDDSLVLENADGRMKLTGPPAVLKIDQLVSGLIVAAIGVEVKAGQFEVSELIFPGFPPQKHPLPKLTETKYVAFMSGLNFGSPSFDPLPVQMMFDFICGLLGGREDEEIASQIAQVVIVGDSLAPIDKTVVEQYNMKKPLSKESALNAVKQLDMYVTQLAATVNVAVVPGECDPSNFLLPQQPLNKCLFPSSRTYSTFSCLTNPCKFEVDGIRFLGTSGQNIKDMKRYSNAENDIDYLRRTLEWRHVAPTAPDTLELYPFRTGDPFLIDECPHVYFASNQNKFETERIEGKNGQVCRLVMIPSFAKSPTLVLMNVADLECKPIVFSAPKLSSSSPSAAQSSSPTSSQME